MLLALCNTHSGIYIYLDQFLNDYRMNFQRTRGLVFFSKIPRQTYQHTASPAVVNQHRDLLPSFSSSHLHLPCLGSQKRLSSSYTAFSKSKINEIYFIRGLARTTSYCLFRGKEVGSLLFVPYQLSLHNNLKGYRVWTAKWNHQD